MNGWVPSLAQINRPGDGGVGPPTAAKSTGLLAHDPALVILSGICLTVLLVAWAVRIWRKSSRRQRKYKRVGASGGARSPATPTPPPSSSSSGSVTRRRLRAHRPRNPTLAERGGLPPLRPDPDSPPTSH